MVTTFDIRMTRPNFEPVMNTAEIHTLEHLGATFLRNHEEWSDKIIYFGPMGCRTGFIFCLPVTMNRKILSFVKCLSLSVILRARFGCGTGGVWQLFRRWQKYLAEKYLEHVLTGITPDRLKY